MADDLTCRWCGEPKGNAGALAQHESACDHNPDNHPEVSDVPERQEPAETRPATQRAESAGGTLADALIAATDNDLPADARRDAIRGGLGIVGDAIVRYQTYREQKMQQQRQRAENVELEPVKSYPQCECDYQFGPDDIGINDSEVRCPGCDRLYHVRDVEGEPA